MSSTTKPKLVQIYVDEDLRRAIKIQAAQHGLTIADELRRLLNAEHTHTGKPYETRTQDNV